MRKLLALFPLALPLALAAQAPHAAAPLPSFAEPGIAPDGTTVAFVSGGDIWEVAAGGGEARLLVSHPAAESRPMYSTDGRRLAFTSSRTGNGDIYVLTLATGELRRLTFDDAVELVNGWSPDSQRVYFSSSSHDLSSMADVFRVAADGGTPMPVAADRYATEYFGAPAHDGVTVAITARAFAGSQWWRNGHSHLDESEIWLVRAAAGDPKYEPVTTGGAKDAWPMWGPGGKTLYFMSDRSGAQNVWTIDLAQDVRPAKAVTTFKDGRVLWPTISRDGLTIAFERNFGIWTLNTATRRAVEIPITLRGVPAAAAVEHRTFTDQIQELALSPDGKKIAFTVHGEIFSASAKDGGDAVRLTETAAEEFGLVWAPDSRRLAYVSDRVEGTDRLFLYDFASGKETALTAGTSRDHAPLFSPDGKWIAFQRGNRELRVVDPATGQDRLVAGGLLFAPRSGQPREFDWSPDSRYLVYVATGSKSFQNVHVVPVTSAAPNGSAAEGRAISFLANTNGGSVAWSPDGTFVTFVSGQRTEPGRVVRVNLIPQTPKFHEDQFRDLFREQAPRTSPTTRPAETPAEPAAADTSAAGAAPRRLPAPPVAIDFADIRRRASVVPIGLNITQQVISPDGKWLLLGASAADQENLYLYSIDELSREPAVARQLTSTAGAKRSPRFTPDSKEVLYLDRGRVFNVTLEKREPKAVAVTAELDVDFSREKLEVFHQAWSLLRDQFFDERMNGVDWNRVRTMYEPRVEGARTSDELRRVISFMLGDLNASHMGISAPPQATQTTLGRLGVDFDRIEYEANGRLRVTNVLPLGPAALVGLKAGEYILRANGQTVGPRLNLDQALDHTIGKRIALSVAAAGSPTAAPREVVVKPMNQTTEKGLRYRQWVDQKREYVSKASGGRLGYAHMYDMSETALTQLHLDLDADNHAREGVVIDVRNNNGGFVNVYAIDVLTRRGYFNMARRDVPIPPVSSRTMLGQRALERPTILVTNQHSLSDAEDFTEGYRALKLGKVVGEPTAGWIIYTGNLTLIDGSVLRMPATKIFASDGSPMEMHPRPVDVPVTRPMGESYTAKDVQLDTAVAELLKQVGAARQP